MGSGPSHHHETDNTKIIQEAMLQIAELDKVIDERNQINSPAYHNIQVGLAKQEAEKTRNELYVKCLKHIETKIEQFRKAYHDQRFELSKRAIEKAPTKIHAWEFLRLNDAQNKVCYPTAQVVYATLQRSILAFEAKNSAKISAEPKELAKPGVVAPKPSGPAGKQA